MAFEEKWSTRLSNLRVYRRELRGILVTIRMDRPILG